MNAKQIGARLLRLLGKQARYRHVMSNPDAHGRAEWSAKSKALHAEAVAAREACEARRRYLLTDPEYVELRSEWQRLEKEHATARSWTHCYPITAGTVSSVAGFSAFHVRAQGDTWAEVFAILERGKA